MKEANTTVFQFECPMDLYEILLAESKLREMTMTQIMRAAMDAAIKSGNVQAEKTTYGVEKRACVIPIKRGGVYDNMLNSCGSSRRKGVMVNALRAYLSVKA